MAKVILPEIPKGKRKVSIIEDLTDIGGSIIDFFNNGTSGSGIIVFQKNQEWFIQDTNGVIVCLRDVGAIQRILNRLANGFYCAECKRINPLPQKWEKADSLPTLCGGCKGRQEKH